MSFKVKFPRFQVTVVRATACARGYKPGDEFIWENFTEAPPGFCQGAAHALFPVIYALSFGAAFPFAPDGMETTCPDGGTLTFRTVKLEGE